ncbi:dynein regulatory complex protein 9-like isoform X1 [Helicoverpa zea]|uniref:dynein regulatory complex protein 9-like isoform X1 n=1 Tax=Helicoverpa zea TaxID=7113 RepID=UPI001F58F112|nr:dynein regulatory complex protein 9-like isoform X1 [Helicoverpa zea]
MVVLSPKTYESIRTTSQRHLPSPWHSFTEGSAELRLATWRPNNKIERLQRDKLVKDRALVKDVIRGTLIEVAETGKWQSVKNAVELLQQSETDVESLRHTNIQLKATRNALATELEAKRSQWAMELRNADQKVAVLRDKMSDDLHNANTRLCYAEKWLFARFESLELKLDVPRPPKPRPDHEHRVHEELLKAFDLQIKEHEKALEYWRQRYDTDIAEISSRGQRKLEQLLIASGKRQELQKLYDLHQGEMRSWLTFKRERAARLAREEKLRLSAMRIQAWWRGVMVRRALGQFKYLRITKGKGKKK